MVENLETALQDEHNNFDKVVTHSTTEIGTIKIYHFAGWLLKITVYRLSDSGRN